MIRQPQPLPLDAMRVAILSPYSWTYPGGVTRHIEALAERFIADGHHVRVLAPFDPPDRYSIASCTGVLGRRTSNRPTTWSRSAAPCR